MALSLRLLSALLLLTTVLAARAYDLGYEPQDLSSDETIRSLFSRWTEEHRKFYNGLGDGEERFSIFKDNLLYIHEYNEQHESHKLGLNEYADLTHEEFKEHRLGYDYERVSNLLRMPRGEFVHGAVAEVPEEVNWVEKGAVTPVKNQARCGSCWAFSTTGAVEGINQLVTGSLTSLSEQELVDCDKVHDMGCQGGLMDFAFQFIIDNGGLDTEEDYPYKGYNERCDVDKENTRVVTIDGFEDVPVNSESSLKQAVSQQPVSVAIEADKRPFQFYRGGVFDGECGTALNHGVLAVGYGVEDGTPYWLVKNSWGPGWGADGYIKIKRDTAPEGLCGIAKVASYPLKKGPNPPPGPPKPHPPAPEPEQCDATHTCNEGTTCCCSIPLGKFCLAWGCCPMTGATCCPDHRHCCPKEYPVCHLEVGLCARGENVLSGSVPMVKKEPADFHFNWAALSESIGVEPLKEQPEEPEELVHIM